MLIVKYLLNKQRNGHEVWERAEFDSYDDAYEFVHTYCRLNGIKTRGIWDTECKCFVG